MITLEQKETSLDIKRAEKESEASFAATLKKAIDLSNNDSAVSKQNDKQFYYSTGTHNFLIEQELKAETLKEMPVNIIPFTPEWYLGIISIRGIIMPVINMNKFVNIQTKTVKNTNKDKSKESNKKTTDNNINNNKSYFLKLEHNAHSPIIIMIDRPPKLINISTMKKIKATKTKPNWMLNTIKNGPISITEVDHSGLLNQIKEHS